MPNANSKSLPSAAPKSKMRVWLRRVKMGMEHRGWLICRCWVSAGLLLFYFVNATLASAQDVRQKALPLVWVLATGGTIAATGSSATDLTNYKSGALPGEQIVAAVPEIKQIANVKVEQVVNIGSYDMTLNNWITLSNRINEILTN